VEGLCEHGTDFVFHKSSSFLIENTPRLYYKDILINAIREIIAVCCENHTKSINTLCGEKYRVNEC
jgi:hypothetical protein